jgi:hypothetical protein
MTKKIPPAPPLTSKKLERLASNALARPSTLTAAQVRELGGALMARIEPRRQP